MKGRKKDMASVGKTQTCFHNGQTWRINCEVTGVKLLLRACGSVTKWLWCRKVSRCERRDLHNFRGPKSVSLTVTQMYCTKLLSCAVLACSHRAVSLHNTFTVLTVLPLSVRLHSRVITVLWFWTSFYYYFYFVVIFCFGFVSVSFQSEFAHFSFKQDLGKSLQI